MLWDVKGSKCLKVARCDGCEICEISFSGQLLAVAFTVAIVWESHYECSFCLGLSGAACFLICGCKCLVAVS